MKNITTQNPVFSGQIGIGTTNPINDLHLHGAITGVGPIIQLSNDTGDCRLFFGANSTTGGANAAGQIRYNVANDHLTFYSNLNERMRIDSGGNVGIGTTNPGAALQIQGSSPKLSIVSNLDNESRINLLERLGGDGDLGGFIRYAGGAPNNTVELGTVLSGTDTSHIYLPRNGTGNVGIGTTNPSATLEVSGTIKFGDGHTIGNGSGDNLHITSSSGENIIYQSSGGINAFWGETSEHVRIDSNGNVGIGTRYPGARLQVKAANAGDVNIHANNITNRASFTMAGVGPTPTDENSYEIGPGWINLNRDDGTTVKQIQFGKNGVVAGYIQTSTNTTSYSTSSDYRLKENVVVIDDAIERINKLKPCRFNFIKTPEIIVDGFIAHEVQEIVPEAISGEKDEEDENGNIVPQGIDQGKLVPLLTAAIQEQQSIIEDLRSRIKTLEQ